METPLAIIALDRMIVIPACKAQQIGRLAFTFRHESEGPHHATAIRLRHILNLAHMMLATGEAWRIAIMFGNPPNPVMPFPDVGIVKHFLHHPRIGREAGDQRIDIAGIQRPAISGDQILQGDPVFDGQAWHDGHSPVFTLLTQQ
ncbi:hypothetical protein MBESOW_P3572 [Sphingobium xenophagum]|uniref:Uncharacterized protein n=1 Tax=Sphingobium xenophagum TaxID=121428 RepID=A0A401J6X4_SPHXE|nr:hypothetical protein MBESOW_P3572 [Sphingobium xenophagum]